MNNRTFAMDTHFTREQLTPEEQAALVKAVGYDDYYVSGSANNIPKFERYLKASQEAGLGLNAAFENFNIQTEPSAQDRENIDRVVSQLPPYARFEIALMCGEFGENLSNSECDDKALAWLEPIAPILEKYDIEASLYPHFGFYLETFTDGLRLARRLNHSKIKVIFCGYHYFRVGKEDNFADLFADAGRWLNAANLCGSRFAADEADEAANFKLNPSIEPLDAGTMDNAGVVRELKRSGFTGSIGIQGYEVNDTAENALRRSHVKLRELLEGS